MKSFTEFIDRKTRRARKQLGTVQKILKRDGLTVMDFLEDEEPYIFLKNPGGSLSFDGIRIYKIGGDLAFRVQKEDKTHPYGKAYMLDVEGMYNDLLSDSMGEQKAGEETIKAVTDELRKFFSKSSDAEKDLRSSEFDMKGDPMGSLTVNPQGTDYSNSVQNSSKGM